MYFKILDNLINFFFPRVCFSCGNDVEFDFINPLCRECYKKLDFIENFYCRICGRKIDNGDICFLCLIEKRPNFSFLRSVFMYNDQIASLIIAYKYHNHKYLYKWFSKKLYERFLNYPEFREYDSITYIPLSKRKLKKRGFNQTQLIAKDFSNKTGLFFLENISQKIKETRNQVELSKEERKENLKDAFIIVDEKKIYDKKIIVIDDVSTTMSTLNEFSKVLIEKGAKKVSCFTIARE